MADVQTLEVSPRDRAGKGSARAARRDGQIPAVVYGDKRDPAMITISRNKLVRVIARGGFLNTMFELELDGKTQSVLPRDLQLHPVTDEPMHVDFLRLGEGATVVIDIPVRFTDEEECPGLKQGGILNVVRHVIECRARADSLPEAIFVSLLETELHGSIHASSLDLPDGVELTVTDRDFTIATIVPPIAEVVEEVEEDEFAEGEEGEFVEGEGEEGEGVEGEAKPETEGNKE